MLPEAFIWRGGGEGGRGRGNVAGSHHCIFKKEIQNEWIKKEQKKVENISPFLILYIYEIIKYNICPPPKP